MQDRRTIYSPGPQGTTTTEPDGSLALRPAREEGDALLRAAEEAINRVLSRDSDQFLRDARQHGGQ